MQNRTVGDWNLIYENEAADAASFRLASDPETELQKRFIFKKLEVDVVEKKIKTIYSIDYFSPNDTRAIVPNLTNTGKEFATTPPTYDLYIASLGPILIPLLMNNIAEQEGLTKPYTEAEINNIIVGLNALSSSLNL